MGVRRFVIILILIHLCASAIVFAKECSDDLRIDQLPVGKTFLTILDDTELSPVNSNYDCHSGRCKTKSLFRVKDFVNLGRYLHVGITDEFVKRLQGETYVFQGAFNDAWTKSKNILDARFIFINVKYKDQLVESGSTDQAEIRIYQNRSILDRRDESFTYGSMKYNLGHTFKMTAYCN